MTANLSNFDKQWSKAHFVSFLFFYYCKEAQLLGGQYMCVLKALILNFAASLMHIFSVMKELSICANSNWWIKTQ